jgi:hypothetical protein
MNLRSGSACAIAMLATLAGVITATAQAPGSAPAKAAARSKPWTAPRTPDGHPDLQGTWTNGTITPLERPDGSRVTLTRDEVDRLEKGVEDRAKLATRISPDATGLNHAVNVPGGPPARGNLVKRH